MYTDLTLKLKALTLALMINGLIMGGAALLFDGRLHPADADSFAARTTTTAPVTQAGFFLP